MSNNDHEKRNRADRVRRSLLRPTGPVRTGKWLPLGFGKHAGLTLPTIFFTDPGYVGWLKESRIFNQSTKIGRELALQLRIVIERAERIPVPVYYAKSAKFAIVADQNNVFECFFVTPGRMGKSPKLSEGGKIVKLVKHLAVPLVYEYENVPLGYRRMARCLSKVFISRTSPKSAKEQHQAFFDKD